MIGLLQRVDEAHVTVGGERVGAIGRGLLVFIGIERGDSEATATRLLDRLLDYRVFADADGRMNCALRDSDGGLLLVPQFTLAADTRKGLRPSFTPAAPPREGERLFTFIVAAARATHATVAAGRFGADMKISLVNDGPATFWLHVPPSS